MQSPVNHLVLDALTTVTSSQAGFNGGFISILGSTTTATPQIIDISGT
jgi:hypothetical protein